MLYSSGEESEHQIKSRGERLDVGDAPLYLLAETCLERILEEIARIKPALVIVDSIQTVFSLKFQSAPGSIGQVREAATQLLFTAKGQNIPTFLVGHITKDGSLAGPKALEHVVDTVLYFEGERHHSHRVVRAVKNRFGAASELGVFEMTSTGLRPVPNPSKMFLAERPINAPGSAVLCSVEGSRPILVEVQALVSSSTYGNARRMASGIDQQRLTLLLAVLEKRAGLNLIGDDVFVNIAGGMTVDEPASDLGVLAAIASSVRNRVIPRDDRHVRRSRARRRSPRHLAGARSASAKPRRWGSAAASCPRPTSIPPTGGQLAGDCELVGVRTVGEALDACADRVDRSAPRIVSLARFVTIGDMFSAELCRGSFLLIHRAAHFIRGLPQWPGLCSRVSCSSSSSPTPPRCSSRFRSDWPSTSVLGSRWRRLVVLFESRLRETAVTRLLGALIGCAIGLGIAHLIVAACSGPTTATAASSFSTASS